ncbi:uncharacterized protein LOC143232228 [Tachypleus tridentatus]|uniref:uncharacterized protein LOC143232228 n=1 Tax=Tachypleus tridentatus TaxID=6853 RepID=UPI003FD68564
MVKISVIVGFIIMFLLMSALSASLPQYRFQRALWKIEHPDEARRVLNGVVESLLASESGKTEKRGLDLGLSRGFSGSQAAKHLMGLAAANFAGGPGRRRRDVRRDYQKKLQELGTFMYFLKYKNQTRFQRAPVEIEHPDEVSRVLYGVVESLLASESGKTEKRGLDLGLSRGFSGSQAAKHLMGLATANFAGGPGRRRRDVSNQE